MIFDAIAETLTQRQELVRVALGKEPADLVIPKCNLINVCTATVDKAGVAVSKGRIACVGNVDHTIGTATETIEAADWYVAPGLIDSHMHIESSRLTPIPFSELVIPHGTTCIVADPHEIANVLGSRGIRLFIEEAKFAPLRIGFTAPSCVPSASPRFETAGAILNSSEVKKILRMEGIVGLAEVMDFQGVLNTEKDVLQKIQATAEKQLVVDGHAQALTGKQLAAFIASGIQSDHTARLRHEAVERLRRGLRVMLQHRPGELGYSELLRLIVDEKLDTRNCMLCSDDPDVTGVKERGHMDFLVKKAVEVGVDPIKALQMPTINPATYFRLDGDLGQIAPGKYADLVFLNDLSELKVTRVIIGGRIGAQDGILLKRCKQFRYPAWATHTVRLKPRLAGEDIAVRARRDREYVSVRVTSENEPSIEKMRVENGVVNADPGKDIAKMVVAERHGLTQSLAVGFYRGLGVREGAIGSTIAHDAHNAVAIGIADSDIILALKSIQRMQGGLVVVNGGRILAKLPLPIAGLMNQSTAAVANGEKDVYAAAKKIGLTSSFLRLCFLTLPVGRRKWTLTDRGLVDYPNGRILSIMVRSGSA